MQAQLKSNMRYWDELPQTHNLVFKRQLINDHWITVDKKSSDNVNIIRLTRRIGQKDEPLMFCITSEPEMFAPFECYCEAIAKFPERATKLNQPLKLRILYPAFRYLMYNVVWYERKMKLYDGDTEPRLIAWVLDGGKMPGMHESGPTAKIN